MILHSNRFIGLVSFWCVSSFKPNFPLLISSIHQPYMVADNSHLVPILFRWFNSSYSIRFMTQLSRLVTSLMGNYLAERGTGGTGLPLVCHTIRSTAARQRAALFYKLQDKFKLGRSGEVMSHTAWLKTRKWSTFWYISTVWRCVFLNAQYISFQYQYLYAAVSYKVIFISFLF